MKIYTRNINRLVKNFDVSPFARRSLINLVLYLFAGINIIIYTGKNTDSQRYFYKDQVGHTVYRSVEAFNSGDAIVEKFELVSPEGFSIIPSSFLFTFQSRHFNLYNGRSPPLTGQLS